MALSSNQRPNGRRSTSMMLFQTWIDLFSVVLRTLLWPLRRVGEFLLPPGEFDGLSPAVTEKATQQFVSYLKTLTSNPTHLVGIQEAFSTTGYTALRQEAASSGSLLLVYLHSPFHRMADDVCKRLLLSPAMLEFLAQDRIYALGSSIHTSQGASLAAQLSASSYPLLALLQPMGGTTTGRANRSNNNHQSNGGGGNGGNSSNNDGEGAVKLIFKAEGPALVQMTQSQLLNLLGATFQRHQMTVQEQEARRLEREQETELRRQQDEEYQEGLRADQERERKQKEEREELDRLAQEAEERERRRVQEEQDGLNRARAMIKPEPSTGGTRIRFQLPTGQKLERRFGSDETVGSVRAFLILHFAVKGNNVGTTDNNNNNKQNPHVIKNIGLSTNFPKRTLDDDTRTLQEYDLGPQAVLMVQDLDA